MDKPLSPFKTPVCEVEHRLFCLWIATPEALKNDRIMALGELMDHRASCEICRARMEEMNELSKRCSNSCEAMCMDD